jgi:hypothetical protein
LLLNAPRLVTFTAAPAERARRILTTPLTVPLAGR